MGKDECEVCRMLLRVCKKLDGKKGEKYCKFKLKQLEEDKITTNEFDKQIYRHFGNEKVNREFDKTIKKMLDK